MMSKNNRRLIWLRNDLRMMDNILFSSDYESSEETIVIYFHAIHEWKLHKKSNIQRALIFDRLKYLYLLFKEKNIPFFIFEINSFSEIPDFLIHFMKQFFIQKLLSNYEYEYDESERDHAVHLLFSQNNLEYIQIHNQTLLEPGTVLNGEKKMYKVFTPFKKKWIHQLNRSKLKLKINDYTPLTDKNIFDSAQNAYFNFFREIEYENKYLYKDQEILERFNSFVLNHLADYENSRDIPAINGTSKMSPYLAVGIVSPQTLIKICIESKIDLDNSWINEIIWREFYIHLLQAFPDLGQNKPFLQYTKFIPWNESKDDFNKWKKGITGFPIVDAGMRQLLQEGWMHNRVRMIVASFLTKNLLIHWKKGQDWFMQHLVDGTFASNNGGWQWAASTGTDSQPYFRVFNPITQSMNFDPNGEYIKKYVPELKNIPRQYIHEPWDYIQLHSQNLYYQPMVSLSSSRKKAIETFKYAKEKYENGI